MRIAYIIMRGLVNLAFIAMATFLSVYTNNYHFLWFLVIPILSHLGGITFNED